MSDKRYLGNIITDTPTEPSSDFANSSAKGVWSLAEQLAYQKAGLWPVPGKFPVDIDDVFSTYLYDGTGSAQTITNGIDLAGEGGLVWIKKRSGSANHYLSTNETGGGWLYSNQTNSIVSSGNTTTFEFQSNGFINAATGTNTNGSGEDYASWTFRKAPKFFDVVTYTGGSSQPGVYSHGLKSTPGMIIFKKTSGAEDWWVWHRSAGGIGYAGNLNTTGSFFNAGTVVTAVSDTTFSVNYTVNGNGDSYVAYVFAHNNNDGGFGPDSDQDIIKCGSYTGTGSYSSPPTINLGFEPQWVMIKRTDGTASWQIYDVMRGATDNASAYLRPDQSAAEQNYTGGYVGFYPTSTGFSLSIDGTEGNASGGNYIYMAIRRGPLAVPEDGTEVFAIDTPSNTTPVFVSGFTADMGIWRYTASTNTQIMSRITGKGRMYTNLTNASSNSGSTSWDYQNGWFNDTSIYGQSAISWMWKRAPGYFDAVAYSGNSTAGRTVSHNLGVAPEMMWIKKRNSSYEWIVYSPAGDGYLRLNTNEVYATSNVLWNATSPTATEFTLGGYTHVNGSGDTYIAYLFASAPGVSKVGSASHSGTTNVDCGFTSGARFVLIKRTDASGDWYVWDSERGIVAGNDPYLLLDSTAAEVTNTDYIDPLSSGFTITSSFTAGTYIFYAIA